MVAPFGAADVQALAYAATQAVDVVNQVTILNFAILTGDTTLNLSVSPEVKAGARLTVIVPATANADDLAFGDLIDAPALVGVAGKTKCQDFVYDGARFVGAGAFVQID